MTPELRYFTVRTLELSIYNIMIPNFVGKVRALSRASGTDLEVIIQ